MAMSVSCTLSNASKCYDPLLIYFTTLLGFAGSPLARKWVGRARTGRSLPSTCVLVSYFRIGIRDMMRALCYVISFCAIDQRIVEDAFEFVKIESNRSTWRYFSQGASECNRVN
jgi:hypothetical protein